MTPQYTNLAAIDVRRLHRTFLSSEDFVRLSDRVTIGIQLSPIPLATVAVKVVTEIALDPEDQVRETLKLSFGWQTVTRPTRYNI